MRLHRHLVLALPILSFAIGCGGSGGTGSSAPPAPPPPTVASTTGIWTGKYGNGSNTPNWDYRMVFFADGKSRVIDGLVTIPDGTNTAAGIWSLSGSTVTGAYTYPNSTTFSTTGTLNSALTVLAGTWGSGTNTTDGGSYSLTKEEGAVLGIWTGKYGSGTATPNSNYRFILCAGGALQADSGDGATPWSSNGKGTWTQSGAVVTGTYTYYIGGSSTFSFSGTVAGTAMTGTWGSGANTTGGGTFTLTR